MKLTPQLKAKVAQAVQTTMRIEGYTTPRTELHKQSARQLMERARDSKAGGVQMPRNGDTP